MIMFRHILVAALAATSTALSIPREASQGELFTIELTPGVTQVVTEAEKWALKEVSRMEPSPRCPGAVMTTCLTSSPARENFH